MTSPAWTTDVIRPGSERVEIKQSIKTENRENVKFSILEPREIIKKLNFEISKIRFFSSFRIFVFSILRIFESTESPENFKTSMSEGSEIIEKVEFFEFVSHSVAPIPYALSLPHLPILSESLELTRRLPCEGKSCNDQGEQT